MNVTKTSAFVKSMISQSNETTFMVGQFVMKSSGDMVFKSLVENEEGEAVVFTDNRKAHLAMWSFNDGPDWDARVAKWDSVKANWSVLEWF